MVPLAVLLLEYLDVNVLVPSDRIIVFLRLLFAVFDWNANRPKHPNKTSRYNHREQSQCDPSLFTSKEKRSHKPKEKGQK